MGGILWRSFLSRRRWGRLARLCKNCITEVDAKVLLLPKSQNSKLQFLSSSMSGEILGIIGQDPSVSKSNQLHVDIFRFFFYLSQVYSIDSSRMMGNFPEVLNFNQLFLKLNQFVCNKHSVFPVRWSPSLRGGQHEPLQIFLQRSSTWHLYDHVSHVHLTAQDVPLSPIRREVAEDVAHHSSC